MPTRRQVIFGKFHGSKAPSRVVRPAFSESCLARQGVVCRSCGEACEAGAIVFRPTAGGISPPVLRVEPCTGCGDCAKVCPVGALSLAPIDFPEELPA